MRYLFLAFSLCFLSTACATSADYIVCDSTSLIDLHDLTSLKISPGEIRVDELDEMEAAASEAGWDMADRKPNWFSMMFIKLRQRIKFYNAYDVANQDRLEAIEAEYEAVTGDSSAEASASVSIGDDNTKAKAKSGSKSKGSTYKERKTARKKRRRAKKAYRKARRAAFNAYIDDALAAFAKDARTTCQVHPFTFRLEDDRIELIRTDDQERPYQVIVIYNGERIAFASPKKHADEKDENYRFRIFHTAMRHLLYYLPESEPPAYISE